MRRKNYLCSGCKYDGDLRLYCAYCDNGDKYESKRSCDNCLYHYKCDHRCLDCIDGSKWEEKIDFLEILTYTENDVKSTQNAYEYMMTRERAEFYRRYFEISKVIFNEPATIVIWADGTKTVVKAQDGEEFDPEKGMAMAISKRALGDKGNYYEEFKKWVEPYVEVSEEVVNITIPEGFAESLKEATKSISLMIETLKSEVPKQ